MAKIGRAVFYDAAGTYTLNNVEYLDGILVGTGEASATVTIRHATSDDEIAVIDAASPDAKRMLELDFSARVDLEIVVVGAPKVTVFYD